MSFIEVVGGDFRNGRVPFDGIGFGLQASSGKNEYVKFADIRDIQVLEREVHSSANDRLVGSAAGGIVGGLAAGAMTGGLTGPAGAVIGAAAGAILAANKYSTCHVSLRDGRQFVATGKNETWKAIRNAMRVAVASNRAAQVESVIPTNRETFLSKVKSYLSHLRPSKRNPQKSL